MKAIIYCRFSPRRNGTDCQSNEVQLEYCRRYCRERGYSIAGEYEDRESSGDDEDRNGLWAAIAALKRGSVFVAHKYDRIARSVYLDEYIRRQLAKKGASIEVVEGGREGDTPHDVMVRQILAAVAEAEKKITAARTRAAMLMYQSQGLAMSHTPPYGFRRAAERLLPDEAEQDAIRAIVAMRASGASYRAIARQLTENTTPCRGRVWRHGLVKAILDREAAKHGRPGENTGNGSHRMPQELRGRDWTTTDTPEKEAAPV